MAWMRPKSSHFHHHNHTHIRRHWTIKKILETCYVIIITHFFFFFFAIAIAILRNHTFAAIRGKESYELLSTAFGDLICDINRVIKGK